jgi:pyridoxine 5-phosphate synthase
MATTTALSVNLNKVALLRNQRDVGIPSVTRAARICVEAGAHGITVHPRPDERHIRASDVRELAAMLTVEFNIEGNPFPELLALVRELRPTQCTLVPDSPEQSTSDHGFVLVSGGRPTADAVRLRPIVAELRDLGVRTSIFMDPDREQIDAAAELGVARIELYTGPYAHAFHGEDEPRQWLLYREAARHAAERGLGVNAGHDLNLENLPRFLAIPGILEVSIGHALIADALELGLAGAVHAYLKALGPR